jgi:hypothetical protein
MNRTVRIPLKRSARLRHALAWALCAGVALLFPGIVSAQAFERGATNVSVLVGSGQAFDESYLVLGIGAGYYIANGLELGLELETWLNGDPDIYKVTPGLRYVFNLSGKLRPYVGGFYRRVFIEDFDDRDSWGGRAGVYIPTGARSYLGLGVVYTELVDCDERIYSTCSDTYPELTFSFAL